MSGNYAHVQNWTIANDLNPTRLRDLLNQIELMPSHIKTIGLPRDGICKIIYLAIEQLDKPRIIIQ